MKGRIHSLQSMGALDGPGLRYIVFMQGCPLRCAYCHNPDTWDPGNGIETTSHEVFEKLERFRPYFGKNGGVTVSGGEALMQPEFVTDLFERCRRAGIHTALDTSGCMLGDAAIERLLDVTDLVLLDIKMTSESDYAQYVGMTLERALDFLAELERRGIPVWIRHVVVSGFNDSEQDILKLDQLISGYGNIERVELLPFTKLCREKYDELGIEFRFDIYPETPTARTKQLEALLQAER